MRITPILMVSAALLLGISIAAQQPQNPPEAQQPIQVEVNLVHLFATVRDSHKALVPDLKKDDFHVFENGTEQKLTFFAAETTLPITLGLMIDTSGSQSELLGLEQAAGSRFLHKVMRKGDEAMEISFDTDVNLLSDFTQDLDQLERGLQKAKINAPVSIGPIASDPRGTALYDAIYVACHDQLAGEVGRKALVILTDAEDVGSRMTVNEAIEAAQRADAVIHIILIADPGQYGFGGYGGASVAHKMADETGGRVIETRNPQKLDDAFDELSKEMRSQYALGYVPTNAAHDGAFRKVQVNVDRPGLKVLTRKGYYAPIS